MSQSPSAESESPALDYLMDDTNETSSVPAGLAHRPALDALPIEILFEVVPHTDVVSAIQMTLVSGFNLIFFTRNESQRWPALLVGY